MYLLKHNPSNFLKLSEPYASNTDALCEVGENGKILPQALNESKTKIILNSPKSQRNNSLGRNKIDKLYQLVGTMSSRQRNGKDGSGVR